MPTKPLAQPQRTQSAQEFYKVWIAQHPKLLGKSVTWPVSVCLFEFAEAYAHSLKQAAAPAEPVADPSKEELKAAPIEIGWLIEKIVDDRPQWLTCAWTFGWTDDAGNAIRFCRRDDAEQIATMMENDDIRITEHQWS